ncbi:hypothetical protein PVK06_007643 [Gossypium arboreum]|uniref:Uncharacterized protein n=1 Tax=Gossypium arboreum TaxID=29729 RepID=A0ABR0QJ18_GOSAR|nr:hypothetical protein PVK06_007643 [Gossypium arboreum]
MTFKTPCRAVLEKFSLVTKFAREASSQLFWETLTNAFSLFERGSSNLSAIDSSQKPRDNVLELPVPVPPDPLEDFSSPVLSAVCERYYKVTVEALRVCRELAAGYFSVAGA